MPTTFNVVTNPDTASNLDFTAITVPATFTIPAGDLTTTINVTTTDDNIVELQEQFNLVGTITSTNINIAGSSTNAIGIIVDNDNLSVIVDDATTAEGNVITFPVTLSNPISTPITLTFVLTNGTAGDLDYTTTPVTITIPANTTTSSFNVQTTSDNIDESSETFNVAITTTYTEPINITDTAIGTITDDPLDTATFDVGDITVLEGEVATVTVTLSNPSSVDTVINIVSSNGTATAPIDYTPVTTQVTIPAGQLSATVLVSTIEDTMHEPDETVIMTGTLVTGTTSNSNDSGTVTITNDDQLPIFSISSPIVEEGNIATVTISLSNPSSVDTVINIVTVNGTAISPEDYTTVTTQVTIPAGQTSVTVDVTTNEDLIHEPDETVIVNGTIVTGTVSNSTASGTVTITNDDNLPLLTISNETETEGTPLVFTLTLSNPSSVDTVIILNTTEGTAISPEDYDTITNLTVTIPAGQTTFTVSPVNSVDDTVDELDENFTLNGTVTSNNTSNQTATGTGIILDGDTPPFFTISSPTVLEGGILNFIVSLSNPSVTDVVIDVVTNPLTATSGADYTPITTQVTILAGQTSATVAVQTIVDNINEPSETLILNGTAVSTNTSNTTAQGTGTIDNDNITGPIPTISISNETETEGTSLLFTVTLSNPSYTDTVIVLNSVDGTATSPNDYASVSTITVTIPAGQTSVTISPITTVDDLLNEVDENFNLNGTVTTANTVNTNPIGVGTIVDNDAAIIASDDSYNVQCSKSTLLGNILSNDVVNGTVATTSTAGGLTPNVTLTIISGLNSFINIDGLGNISVLDGIPFGTYPIEYQICELGNPLNCASATITIVVEDNLQPVVINQPADTSYQCITEVPAVGSLNAVDNCAGPLTAIGVDTTDNTDPCNIIITRTWTFNDGTNPDFVVTQTITVQDTTAPVFTGNLPDDVTVECSDDLPTNTVQATDNCSATPIDATFTDSALLPDTSGDCTVKGIIERSWVATDACGNATPIYIQKIKIVDTTKPTVDATFQPTIEATCDAIPNETPTFADNCTASANLIITGPTETTGDTSSDGKYTITRTWEVSDGCNTETFTQIVNVTIPNYFQEMNLDADCNDNKDGEDINLFDLISTQFTSVKNGGIWSSEDSSVLGDSFDSINGIFNPYQVPVGYYTIVYEVNDPDCPQSFKINLRVDNDCIPGACETLTVNNAISANNDGDNEFLFIDDITDECYLNNTVEIYNRWGVLVFETQNYDNETNVFKGESGGRVTIKKSEELPTGTYFYIINYRTQSGQSESIQGYLYLTR